MKSFLTYILCFFIASTALADSSISFVAKSSHKSVQVGQRFQVTFTVNANGGSFTPPPFEHFELSYGGGQSSSVQNINGKVTRTNSISYVLLANKEGTFTIAPASLEIDGETYRSNELEIEVVAQNANSANAQRQRNSERQNAGQALEDYIYMTISVDKNSAYVGEKITAKFTLYSQLPVSRVNPEKLPDLKGFWSENITDYSSMRLHNENINGVNYQVAEVQEIILFPQRAGELLIDPLEMNAIVQVRTRRAQSIWDQMMGGGYENREVTLKSKPIKLNIKALPKAGRPADFSGSVGQYTMDFVCSKRELKTNEALDIEIKIEGKGNIPLLAAPKLEFPSDFETYDPEIKTNIQTTSSGSSGGKIFSYLVIPRHPGTFKLEPYTFNYFDPVDEKYKYLSHEPVEIVVKKGAQDENVVYSQIEKEDVAVLGKDIRYIKTQPDQLIEPQEKFYGTVKFYSLISFSFLSFFGLFLGSKKFKEKQADQVGMRKSKAKRLAQKRMAKANKLLKANELDAFYEEISSALFGYFGDKFNISQAEISQERIAEELPTEELKQALVDALERAEMARFAPNASLSAEDLYQKSVEIISKTEDMI